MWCYPAPHRGIGRSGCAIPGALNFVVLGGDSGEGEGSGPGQRWTPSENQSVRPVGPESAGTVNGHNGVAGIAGVRCAIGLSETRDLQSPFPARDFSDTSPGQCLRAGGEHHPEASSAGLYGAHGLLVVVEGYRLHPGAHPGGDGETHGLLGVGGTSGEVAGLLAAAVDRISRAPPSSRSIAPAGCRVESM